ncbi:MAG: YdjY domain-containing protein [Pirellulales bacterium]
MTLMQSGRTNRNSWVCLLVLAALAPAFPSAYGQHEDRPTRLKRVEKTFGDPPEMKRISETDRVWVDAKKHRVVADGYVAMRNGQLEMFACPAGTKEHESVVGLFSKAHVIHAGLLAAGAKSGTPVQWEPSYRAPTGSEIQIHVLWVDKEGKKQVIDARKWIREMGRDRELDTNWVFAGSSFWKDPDSGEERYMAESGDLVCISNFSTATLDIPTKSSHANSGLLFAAYTDRIPVEGTPVRLVFQLVTPNDNAGNKKPAETPKGEAEPKEPKPVVDPTDAKPQP